MRDYIVLQAQDPEVAASMEVLAARLVASGDWRIAARRRGVLALVETLAPPSVVLLPGVGGFVIGELFDTFAAHEGRGRAFEIHSLARRRGCLDLAQGLIEGAFGRYLAVLTPEDAPPLFLRDPVGVVEALAWKRDGLAFVASRLPDDRDLWPTNLAVDWGQIAAILRQKVVTSGPVPLTGVTSLEPGVLARPGQAGMRLWSPAAFARRPDTRLAPEDLARLLDGVVAAWSEGKDKIVCEISGGVDSSLVAAALRRCRPQGFGGVHHYWPEVEADERPFAQAVADQVGADLTCVPRGTLILDADKLAASAGGPRPSYMAGDPDHDADLAARIAGGGTLITGRGGDAVFFQMPSTELAGDLLRGAAVDGGRAWALARLARRRGRTVWSLVAEALRDWAKPLVFAPSPLFLASPHADAPPALHPWLASLAGVSPAKRVQIRSIANNLSAFGESLRHRAGDVIDPLLAQPVLELLLTVPAPRLALGPYDRPFVRAAYAGRVPDLVLTRQGKGDLAVFFSKSLATSLDFLRPYLLDGRLAAQGLIDRQTLDLALAPESLIWSDQVSEIFVALAAESWVRVWEARLEDGRLGSARSAA